MLAILKKILFAVGILYPTFACQTNSSSGITPGDIYRSDEGSNTRFPLDNINIKNVTGLNKRINTKFQT
jgi:hypothetical protein